MAGILPSDGQPSWGRISISSKKEENFLFLKNVSRKARSRATVCIAFL